MEKLLVVLNCIDKKKFPDGSSTPPCKNYELDDQDTLGQIRDEIPAENKVAKVWQVNQGTSLVCDRTSCKKRCGYGFV